MTFDEAIALPLPDERIEPARRHCYEVACDLLWLAEHPNRHASPADLRAFAGRLLEGVALKYGGVPAR